MLLRLLMGLTVAVFLLDDAKAVDDETRDDTPRRSLRAQAEFTLFDLPYNNLGDPRWPSMAQSLTITKSFYELAHAGIEQYLDPTEGGWQGFWNRMGFVGFDVLTMSLPLSSSWLHEEWHRAVMGRHAIDSHNGVYNMKGGSVIPVDRVKDDDLRRLKENYNPDMVRLSAAGMEAEHELAFSIERDHFVQQTRTFDYPSLLLFKASPAFYLQTCATSESNRLTDDQNVDDGSDIPKRDFTGLDCDAWIYDLNRPDEPYAARGTHPSGVGVDRYIKVDRLTDGERSYLKLQSQLTWLNFVDPWLIGIESFGVGNRWNMNLRHELASFGYSVSANIFRETLRGRSSITSLQVHRNGVRAFPGIDFQSWRGEDMNHTNWSRLEMFRFAMWTQPKGQRFDTDEGVLGALVASRFGLFAVDPIGFYGEFTYKTQGWVVGEPNLDRGGTFRIGASASIL